MKTLIQNLTALVNAIGADVKNLIVTIGNLANLKTTSKASVVTAVNELYDKVATASTIVDTAPSTSSVYSSTKTESLIATARQSVKDEIIGGASPAYDTLLELQNGLAADQSSVSSLITTVGGKVSFNAAQSLTTPQQTQARANIGAYGLAEIGDPDTDLVAIYNSAKA